MKTFWQDLKKPFFVLAPMEQVTDTVFRQIVCSCAKPDVFFTEFTSTGGIVHAHTPAVMNRLEHTPIESPLIAQIWGNNPDDFYEAARYIAGKGFSGIDINTGCPDKSVVKHGSGSALINNPNLLKELVGAVKKGAPELPISIKTRIGFNSIITKQWVSYLLSLDINALTIHGRTRSEMSKVPAHWDEIGKAVQVRNEMGVDTVIIGNGDVKDREDGIKKYEEYGVDGIMIGRGIFSNVYVFDKDQAQRSKKELINKLLEHTDLFEKTWGDTKDFNILKKFYKIYIKDFDSASRFRIQLMNAKNFEDVREIVSSIDIDDTK